MVLMPHEPQRRTKTIENSCCHSIAERTDSFFARRSLDLSSSEFRTDPAMEVKAFSQIRPSMVSNDAFARY